jgi:hypothetical protein
MAIFASTLARIKSDPLACLGGKQRVNEHFAQTGHLWRNRVLDPATTLMLFILQVLHGNTAISHLKHLSGITTAQSSYCNARKRLPLKALARLVEHVCCNGIKSMQQAIAGPARWLGRRVVLADATCASAPDTAPLQRRWPQPAVQKPGCGFPIVKLLGALDLTTGMILHLTMMCLNTHEMSQLMGFHAMLEPGDVLLADRGFCSFVHIALLAFFPVDAVFRMHQKQIVDFTPNRPHHDKRRKNEPRQGRPTSRFIKRLGHQDQLVEWTKPTSAPAWAVANLFAALSRTLVVRELRYRIIVRGRRTREVTIATTLLDPMRYPKRLIAELYGLRWEVETNFRHLKQTMGMDQLKCKTPDGVLKELMIFVLVYNLVRAAIVAAAQRQGIGDANRVSFIDALRQLRSRLIHSPCNGDSMTDLIINHIRPGRWHPRVKKRRIQPYDFMMKPRGDYPEPSTAETLTA